VRTRNHAAWLVAAGAFLTLVATITVPPLRSVFRFAAVPLPDAALAIACGAGSLAWFELVKWRAPGWNAPPGTEGGGR